MRRVDGRESEGTLRPLSCELSSLHRADGSAFWKSGATYVLAGVYGPLSPQSQTKEGQKAVVSVVIKSPGQSVEALVYEWTEFLSNILSSCIDCEKYPRAVVQVVLQIIQADGSLLASLLHASVAALMDSGVDLLYLPVATTCLVKRGEDSIRLDPTEAEEVEANSTLLVLVNQHRNTEKLLGSHTTGLGLSFERFMLCAHLASKVSPAILAFWRLAVEQKLTRESQTLWAK